MTEPQEFAESELWVVVVITGDWNPRWHDKPQFGEFGPGALVYGPYLGEEAATRDQDRWNRTMSAETGRAFANRVRHTERLLY